ncbi:3-hydroxy-3-methylglutaryl-coenzyme A reductase-like [Pyrus ussuriensis x Pyrus communis]|uniref:hydroxymethylglutaryl-CoA reductase (NADPH) n=1 Tax=Pyrus ussuriensis x Pyrus communis TaxID=2448454 RepID=A0A5N5HRC6_9ROSA|nr:3-hydroxy-3-methylglutaryl-coenzyme A reductase-like [Pyrus ussuriensis x Pyrus communis]
MYECATKNLCSYFVRFLKAIIISSSSSRPPCLPLKINVAPLYELNMLKNCTGSTMAGALGGFNTHARYIISAIYITAYQDPAQNVERSHYITVMEPINSGQDLHVSITMPSIEVGTVGGGTQLASLSQLV